MSLSNADLFNELQDTANGRLEVVYQAIAQTPERPVGLFGQKSKRADDVKSEILKILAGQSAD
jgi:hypothetical protein